MGVDETSFRKLRNGWMKELARGGGFMKVVVVVVVLVVVEMMEREVVYGYSW